MTDARSCSHLIDDLRKQSAQYARVEGFCLQQHPQCALLLNGGTARDLLLGEKPKDIDLLMGLNGDPFELAADMMMQVGGAATARDFPTVRFVRWHPDADYAFRRSTWGTSYEHVDLSLLPGDAKDVEQKLAEGDFTINCLGIDARTGAILDPLGGYADLKNRVLRAGGGDWEYGGGVPRAMRALRFISAWDLTVEQSTQDLLYRCLANLLSDDEDFLAARGLAEQSLQRIKPEQPGYDRVQQFLADERVDEKVRQYILRAITIGHAHVQEARPDESPNSLSL